jgi:hypothetical protein
MFIYSGQDVSIDAELLHFSICIIDFHYGSLKDVQGCVKSEAHAL